MKASVLPCLFIFLKIACLNIAAQNTFSVIVQQNVRDSFTRYGIPEVFISLCDSNGILIDTMTVGPNRNAAHNAMSWDIRLPRKRQTLLIKAEHPDYETATQKVDVKPYRQSFCQLPDLLMKRRMKETTLQELTVKATRVQIAYKGDTIVVDAGAFKIPEGSMLDALVARVPGAELKADGTIYMNGRKVDYLTLNGKDFFKGKNRIMLDNLPYYTVRRLKFFEKDVPASQMVHSNTGEKDYVMDVELKPEYSIGTMANAEAGYGTNERWMARLFGLRFTKYSRISLFGGANNINESKPLGTSGFEDGARNPSGENKTYMVGAGYSVDDKRGRFTEELEGTVNWTDNHDESRTSRQTFFTSAEGGAMGNGSVFSHSHDITNGKDFGGGVSNKWQLKKPGVTFNTCGNYSKRRNDMLSRSASFSSNPTDFGSCLQILDSMFSNSVMMPLKELCINKVFDRMKSDATAYSFEQKVTWDKSLANGDILWISIQGNYDKDNREQFSHYNLTYPNGTNPNDFQNRYTPYSRKGYSYNAQGQYILNLLNGWQMRYVYSYTQNYSNTQSDRYRLDMLGTDLEFGWLPSQIDYLQTIDAGNSYKSLYMSKKNDGRISLIKYLNRNKFNLTILASVVINNKNESVRYWRSNQKYVLSQNNWYVEPYAQFSLYPRNTKKRTSIRLEYQSYTQTPNLVQRIDVEDTSNPLAITRGNSDLRLSRSHKMELQANRGDARHNISVKLTANILENQVANGFTYNPATGVYCYRPENVKGNWNTNASLSYHTHADKAKQFRIEGATRFYYVHNVDLARLEGYSTSQLSRVDHYITSQNLKLSYNKESLRLEAVGDFAWNVARRELKDIGDINAFDFSYGISGQYTFPWKIQLATDLKMYSRRGYEESSMNTNELVWNATVSRPFLKGRLVVKVDGFDILNKLSSTRYTVNGQGRTETWQLCMPRYAMLRVAYKFNKNPKKK